MKGMMEKMLLLVELVRNGYHSKNRVLFHFFHRDDPHYYLSKYFYHMPSYYLVTPEKKVFGPLPHRYLASITLHSYP